MNEIFERKKVFIVTEDSNVIEREGYFDIVSQVLFITTEGEAFPWNQVHEHYSNALHAAKKLRERLKGIIAGPPRYLRSPR